MKGVHLRIPFLAAVAVLLFSWGTAFSSPLDTGNWFQVARMSNSDDGMFDGNGAFDSNYTYGTFSSTLQVDDFHRPFNVYDNMRVLFITGDGEIWGETAHSALSSLINAQGGSQSPNITFNAHFGGTDQVVTGNVLSRNGVLEDPWISLAGSHSDGITFARMLWGEIDFNDLGEGRTTLKNTHLGVNVYVSVNPVPLPAALPLFGTGLGLMGLFGWWRRHKAAAV